MIRGGDSVIFENKTLSSLLQDIYNTSIENRNSIKSVTKQLAEFIQSSGDAINIAPIIQAFMEVSVKNDDQLSKIATIVQRIISAEAYQRGDSDPLQILTEDEREYLTSIAKSESDNNKKEIIEIEEKAKGLLKTNV